MRATLPLTIVSSLVLNGCIAVAWPPHRGGGMAEFAPPERKDLVVLYANEKEVALVTQLEDFEARLATAIDQDAMRFVPAETTLARGLVARIRREIAGTLYSEAAADLITLGDRLDIIEEAMTRVQKSPLNETPAERART